MEPGRGAPSVDGGYDGGDAVERGGPAGVTGRPVLAASAGGACRLLIGAEGAQAAGAPMDNARAAGVPVGAIIILLLKSTSETASITFHCHQQLVIALALECYTKIERTFSLGSRWACLWRRQRCSSSHALWLK